MPSQQRLWDPPLHLPHFTNQSLSSSLWTPYLLIFLEIPQRVAEMCCQQLRGPQSSRSLQGPAAPLGEGHCQDPPGRNLGTGTADGAMWECQGLRGELPTPRARAERGEVASFHRSTAGPPDPDSWPEHPASPELSWSSSCRVSNSVQETRRKQTSRLTLHILCSLQLKTQLSPRTSQSFFQLQFSTVPRRPSYSHLQNTLPFFFMEGFSESIPLIFPWLKAPFGWPFWKKQLLMWTVGQRVTPAHELVAFTHRPIQTRPAPHRSGSGPAQPCTVEVEGRGGDRHAAASHSTAGRLLWGADKASDQPGDSRTMTRTSLSWRVDSNQDTTSVYLTGSFKKSAVEVGVLPPSIHLSLYRVKWSASSNNVIITSIDQCSSERKRINALEIKRDSIVLTPSRRHPASQFSWHQCFYQNPWVRAVCPHKDDPFQAPGSRASSPTATNAGPLLPQRWLGRSSDLALCGWPFWCPALSWRSPGACQEPPHWPSCHSGNSTDFWSSAPETDFKVQIYSFCITGINRKPLETNKSRMWNKSIKVKALLLHQ